MHAIILLGGRGTRLQDLYPDRPKALVPVAGRPFLEWQLEWLARAGIRDVHLAAGYRAESIREWMARCAPAGLTLTLSTEPRPLGTAGGLKVAAASVPGDSFWVLNGDSLLPALRFEGCAAAAARRPALATMAIVPIDAAGRYGTVRFDDAGYVTVFREKAHCDAGWINGGVYLASRALLDRIEADRTLSLDTDIFPALCAERSLGMFPAEPPLLDMGTPDGLAAMEQYLQPA